MSFKPAVSMLLLFGACLLGCSPVSVKGEWADKASHNQSFKRILVVGLSPNFNQRCAFEYSLVSELGHAGMIGISSCDIIKMNDKLTRENVDLAVKSSNADAVLTTKLVAGSLGAKEGAGRDLQGGGYYKAIGFGYATDYYGMYGVPVTYGAFVESPSITTVQGEAHIQSALYETHGPSLVYTLDTKAKDLESREHALADVTPAIVQKLKSAGLIG